jgi:hypothetical protein
MSRKTERKEGREREKKEVRERGGREKPKEV